jgi:hypothetical protein
LEVVGVTELLERTDGRGPGPGADLLVHGGGDGVRLDLLQCLDQGFPHLAHVGADPAPVVEGRAERQ